MAEAKDEANAKDAAKLAWGGIGGSGKHAEALAAELLADKRFEALTSGKGAEAAWGGIGGSGKHAEDLTPEPKK
ncbi:hypothetical protein [Bradyrhizobium elkanii]